jgi:hypothetical protein
MGCPAYLLMQLAAGRIRRSPKLERTGGQPESHLSPNQPRGLAVRLEEPVILIGMRRTERFPVPELNAVANEVGWNPFASVYVSKIRGRIIVCAMTSPEKGHYVESEAIAVMSFESETSLLGQSVWKALLLFRSAPNLGSSKKTDWPAFRASGAKSVRVFEDEFVRVSVEAFLCVLRVEAAVPCKAADGLFVGRFITNACEFEEFGELLHHASRCSFQVMEQEFA